METWDFDACGERFLGKDAPAKEAPPFPPFLPPPPPTLQVCFTDSWSPAGSLVLAGQAALSPQGLFLLPHPSLHSSPPSSLVPASAALRLAGAWYFQAVPLIRNEGASLSRYYSCCCMHPPTATLAGLGFLSSSLYSSPPLPLPPTQSDGAMRCLS